MTTVQDILQFMEQVAPQNMKMEWDNVGLLVGSKNDPVSKILVALDPFEHVCLEAADFGAQLLITHHPLIFHGMKSVTDETSVGRGVRILIRNGINDDLGWSRVVYEGKTVYCVTRYLEVVE